MKNTILVTGGAGFIGSHLCEKLLQSNNKVILLDKFQESRHNKIKQQNISDIKKYPNLTIVDADVNDSPKISKIFKEQNISYVIHLANGASVSESIIDPLKTAKTNIIGSTSLFEKATQFKIKHVVFASSALVYGSKAKLPMSEDDPCISPTSSYAVSLRTIELMAKVYNHLYGIPITGLRLFPVMGPKMRQDLFLPVLISAILKDVPVKIYGNGKTARSYIYIDDIVAGIISSLFHPQDYQIINLGSTKPVSLLEIVAMVEKIMQKKAKLIFKPQRQEEIPHLIPSLEKARKLLKFEPQVKIEEGIKRYIKWYMDNLT